MTQPALRPTNVVSVYLVISCLGIAGCGAGLPDRFVVERRVGDFDYRRYQKVLDVEFPIEGNAAVGHTAAYIRRTPGTDPVQFATVFVTVYASARGLSAEVKNRLDTLGTYEVEVDELEGDHVFTLASGSDERWALWVSGRHVVKLGAPASHELPEELAETYIDLYPSDLDEHGRAREGAASAGRSRQEAEEDEELDIPRHLREGAPR